MTINEWGWLIFFILMQLLFAFVVFAGLFRVTKYIFNKIEAKSYFESVRFLNPKEYFPEEEISELKQIFYLFMIVLFALNILYLLFYWKGHSDTLLMLDVLVSLYLAVNVEITRKKDYVILFLLIPFASISLLAFGDVIFSLDLLHSIVFLYYIEVYFNKFMEYSETNSLGIAILLLFLIVFISFLFTIFVENVSPLDSLAMVSNAFTSNGYSILGTSNVGKVNALILVWSGFILSGVGTATLALAIVKRRIDDEFDRLEKLVKKNKKD